MDGPTGPDGDASPESGQPAVPVDLPVDGLDGTAVGGIEGDALSPEEAFQTLASEVRVAALLALLAAEADGEAPLSFSRLQSATGSGSSAGFAYHLRQLSDYFVRKTESGYVLTPAGRRAAEAVVSGAFTVGDDGHLAS